MTAVYCDDVIAYQFEGAFYCAACVLPEHKTPEYLEGYGDPVFADRLHEINGVCCGTCNHSIACCASDNFSNPSCPIEPVGHASTA